MGFQNQFMTEWAAPRHQDNSDFEVKSVKSAAKVFSALGAEFEEKTSSWDSTLGKLQETSPIPVGQHHQKDGQTKSWDVAISESISKPYKMLRKS